MTFLCLVLSLTVLIACETLLAFVRRLTHHVDFFPLSSQVYSTDVQYFKTIEGRTASRIGMRVQLQSIHFGGGPNVMTGGGQLVLRCTAQIGNLYQEYTEKELGVPQKDPVPARGEQ